ENTYYASVELCRIHEIGIPQSVAYSPIILNDTNEITISGCDIESSYVHYLLSCRNAYETELTGNRFMHNTVSDVAFNLTSGRPVAADNQFRNNDLLAWYEGTNRLVDTLGVEITAEALDSIHATTPKNTGTRNEVHVSTADELLAAIGPDTEIVLDAETYDLSKTSNYGKTNGNYYFWQQAYDGYELVIYKVNNMTIRSSDDNMKKHTVSTAPRYANVMHFNMCSNITLSGFTAGHTEAPGDCGGGVIRLTGSKNVLVNNCGLFGCGTIGVDIWSSENVFVTECDIYECSVGGVCVYETDTVTIQNTSFRDLGGYNNGYPGYVVAVMSSSNVTLDGKEVTDRINYSSGKLDASQIGLTINGERTDIFEAEVGSFLRIEAAGAPEDTGITWSYDDPYVINGISQKGYYQVEVTGVGNCLVTALIGDVRMVVLIVGTAPEPSPATKNDYCITYAGTPLVECTAAVGDTIALDTTNFPKDSAPVTIWSTDNKENIRLEYTGDTSCEIKILETGEAIVSAYCGGEVAILKIYCRESW
ncbi:MAG: right-handed parallel beta-helix repeat-containing protein, partial [Oscillospiraceae bacterium]|nr:right-handed parallel beta-helix repeat-containing protein [Oscillospiraceae bacterium]